MKLIAIHDTVGKISALLTLPPDSPLGHVEMAAGQLKTVLELPDVTLHLNDHKMQNHLAEIMQSHVVEFDHRYGTSGKLVRRIASDDKKL